MKIKIDKYFDFRSGSGKRGPWAVVKAKITFFGKSNLVISIWDADKFMEQYQLGAELEIPSLEEGLIWDVKPWKETMFNDITLDQSKITGGGGVTPSGSAFSSPTDDTVPKSPFDDPNIKNLFNCKIKD